MSYPQPSADQYAIRGYQYFRLLTTLVSPGDIYDSAQSGHGFAIGPSSDIANVNIAYFDDQVLPTFMAMTTVSPNRAFVGRIDARNDTGYAPSGRQAKILFWPADIYDPNYRPIAKPAAFDEDKDIINFVPPQLEVIEYFKPLASLTPAREDKEFVFQNYPALLSGGRFYLVLPYYGRKYAFVNFTNRAPATSNSFGIVGVNYAITQDDSDNPYHQETTLLAPAGVSNGQSIDHVIRASQNGMFDALVISLTDAGPAPLRIVMSDVEASE